MSNLVPAHTQVSPYGFTMQGDLQLLHRLMKDNSLYNIPDHARDRIIQDAISVLDDSEATIYARNAASKVLLECDKRNIDMVKMVVPKQVIHRSVNEMTTEEIEEQLDEYSRIRDTTKGLPEVVIGSTSSNSSCKATTINGKGTHPCKRRY